MIRGRGRQVPVVEIGEGRTARDAVTELAEAFFGRPAAEFPPEVTRFVSNATRAVEASRMERVSLADLSPTLFRGMTRHRRLPKL